MANTEEIRQRRPTIERIMRQLGIEGSQGITREQLLLAVAQPPMPPVTSGPLFRALDSDGDGKLSKEEIANASSALAKLDANGDGTISREELEPRRP